jgi:hypothetical protein
MTRHHLIFEQTTSTLYYSNDGRLRLERVRTNVPYFELSLDGKIVLATENRLVVDAYIAGYDLALDRPEI